MNTEYENVTALDALGIAQHQLQQFDAQLKDMHARRSQYMAHPTTAAQYRQLTEKAEALKNRIMTSLNVAGVAKSDELQGDLAGLGVLPLIARIGLPVLKWGAIGTAIVGAGSWVSNKLKLDALTDRIAQGIDRLDPNETLNNDAALRTKIAAGIGVGVIGLGLWFFFLRR